MMRRTRALLLVVLLLVAGLARPAPADGLGERLVLAFYYAWFDMTTWQKPLSDQPAQPYLSADPAAIERHVLQAQQAGIDALVQSWYGPQVENNQTETNFAALLDISTRHGFAAAVDFEVTSPFINSEADVTAALQYLLSVHAAHPAYLRVGGRPVVFFWRQDRFPVETWYGIRDQVDPQHTSIWIAEGVNLDYLGPFDGTHLYSVAWDAQPGATLRRWGGQVHQWNADHGAVRFWVATVMPGYNDLVTGRPDAFVRDRAGGAYYRDCWEGAIESGADWVVITSFNEWMEGSQIEPSVGYGDFYLDLTRELSDLYRASEPLPAGVPPAIIVNPTATPPPTATAVPTPIPTAAPAPTPTATATAAPTATATTTPTPLPTATATSTPTSTPTPTVVPTPTPVPTATPTPPPLRQVAQAVRKYPGAVAGGMAMLLLLLALLRRRA